MITIRPHCLFCLVHLQSNFYAFYTEIGPRCSHESLLTGRTMIQEVTVPSLGQFINHHLLCSTFTNIPKSLSFPICSRPCSNISLSSSASVCSTFPSAPGAGFYYYVYYTLLRGFRGSGPEEAEGVGQKVALPCS